MPDPSHSFIGSGLAPFVVRAVAADLSTVVVEFSEPMSIAGLGAASSYTIPGLAVTSVTISTNQGSVTLNVTGALPKTSYTVTVNPALVDLAAGNVLSGNTAIFLTPATSGEAVAPETAGFCPEDNEAFRQLTSAVPPVYKPTVNPGVHGLLQAFSQGDCVVRDQTLEVKKQLYVETAELEYLNRLGAAVGVQRPAGVGMKDPDYRNLIPAMSYVPKQLRLAIQKLLQIWYGDSAIRASATATNPESYVLADGQTLTLTVNGSGIFTFHINANDYRNVALATAQELADAINRQATAGEVLGTVQTDPATLLKHFNIATSVIGPTGSIVITGGTAAATFAFPTTKQTINSLVRPAVLYEISNNEIVVLLPSSPAVVTRTLKGAMHLNANAAGSTKAGYVFDRKAKYSISGIHTTTVNKITRGSVQSNILVNTLPSNWPNDPGYFLLDFGHSTEEGPIRFLAVPNSGNLVIDPAYVFKFDHAASSSIHYVRSLQAPNVKADGITFAGYVTGLAIARQALEDLIVAATAVGVVVRFLVQAPTYKFSNPALDVNSAV